MKIKLAYQLLALLLLVAAGYAVQFQIRADNYRGLECGLSGTDCDVSQPSITNVAPPVGDNRNNPPDDSEERVDPNSCEGLMDIWAGLNAWQTYLEDKKRLAPAINLPPDTALENRVRKHIQGSLTDPTNATNAIKAIEKKLNNKKCFIPEDPTPTPTPQPRQEPDDKCIASLDDFGQDFYSFMIERDNLLNDDGWYPKTNSAITAIHNQGQIVLNVNNQLHELSWWDSRNAPLRKQRRDARGAIVKTYLSLPGIRTAEHNKRQNKKRELIERFNVLKNKYQAVKREGCANSDFDQLLEDKINPKDIYLGAPSIGIGLIAPYIPISGVAESISAYLNNMVLD